MPCQEKHPRAKIYLKEVFEKKSSHLQLHIPQQSTVRNCITNYYSNCILTFKRPQAFKECIPITLPPFFGYFCLSVPLLLEVVHFKHSPVFGLFMRICNLKSALRLFILRETAIYFR